ncbi:hypothetical protein [Microbacterium sp. CR_7]|uniref:hypothetical protein n=1 Tax=Microbacterium sp. CR_7 TaxID=3055792 RepID=UPI0035BF0A47
MLVAARPPRHRVDFVDQLVGDDSEGQAPREVVLEFRTDPFRTDGADVIHLTDLTVVLGARHSLERQRLRRAKRFTGMIRRRRLPLVLTVDGAEATDVSSRAEQLVRDAASAVTSVVESSSAGGKPIHVIEHSHLRDRFLGFPRADRVPGRLLLTALTTLHPSTRAALGVFGVADVPGWSLRVAGGIAAEEATAYAHSLADQSDAVSLRDEALSDAESVVEVSRAELVIVPAATTREAQMIIMLALSLDRPVLIEDSPPAEALANEVGPSWVRRHSGPLTADALETALAAFRDDPPFGRPNLDARAPNLVSARYHAVYRDAAARR